MVKLFNLAYDRIIRGIIKTFIVYQNYNFLTSWGVPTTDFIVIDNTVINRWYNNTIKRIDFYHLVLQIILDMLRKEK